MEDNCVHFEYQAFQSAEEILAAAVQDCDDRTLCSAIDCMTATATTLRVYERFEQQLLSADAQQFYEDEWNNMKNIFSANVPADGLLMQQDTVIPLLSNHTISELQRRADVIKQDDAIIKLKTSGTKLKASAATVSNISQQKSVEMEKLVEYFQRTENHSLAIRIMSQSWSMSASKAQVCYYYCYTLNY
jgi:hypothetical protein